MKDSRGHGSNGREALPFDRSKIGLATGAQFSGRVLGYDQFKPQTARTVADLRNRMRNAGPGHSHSLVQGIKNLLGVS